MILDSKFDYALGCVMGAFVGDAAGAPLEFRLGPIADPDLDKALSMCGGGSFHIGCGQVTDDSELAMSLAWALSEGGTEINPRLLVKYYGLWYQSKPFDIGTTTRTALRQASPINPNPDKVKESVSKYNHMSMSNGCMMRITPLAVWAHKLSDEDVFQASFIDTSLTHCNEVPLAATAAYCLCIKYLIQTEGDRRTAYENTLKYVKEKKYTEVEKWMLEAASDKSPVTNCCKSAGFVYHGFVWGMQSLIHNDNYVTAIRKVLKQGGDTDTNAAIVGGLIGAAEGFSRIPSYMRGAILSYTGLGRGIPRDEILYPSHYLLPLIKKIYKNANYGFDEEEVRSLQLVRTLDGIMPTVYA